MEKNSGSDAAAAKTRDGCGPWLSGGRTTYWVCRQLREVAVRRVRQDGTGVRPRAVIEVRDIGGTCSGACSDVRSWPRRVRRDRPLASKLGPGDKICTDVVQVLALRGQRCEPPTRVAAPVPMEGVATSHGVDPAHGGARDHLAYRVDGALATSRWGSCHDASDLPYAFGCGSLLHGWRLHRSISLLSTHVNRVAIIAMFFHISRFAQPPARLWFATGPRSPLLRRTLELHALEVSHVHGLTPSVCSAKDGRHRLVLQ